MTPPNVGDDPPVSTEAIEGLTLAAFNTDCDEATVKELGLTLGAYFGIDDVTVGTTITDDQPEEFAVLHDDALIAGSLVHAGDHGTVDAAASTRGPTDTLFLAGYDDREGLRTLSNRIETLAWRAGRGNLYVGGQQRLASMDDQWEIYESIADEGTAVHVFESPELVPGDASQFVVHGGQYAFAGTWLVAFDGDGNDAAKAAMLAEEREPDRYYGVWTVVPELVDRILDRTTERTTDESGPR